MEACKPFRAINKICLLVAVVAALLLGAGNARASDGTRERLMPPPDLPENAGDIRHSIENGPKGYKTDGETHLYHVVAGKSFVIAGVYNYDKQTDIKIKKGDILLMYDVPDLRKTQRLAIVVGEGSLIEIDRSNLKKDKDGNLYRSAPIDIYANDLTSIFEQFMPTKPSVGKYIYEKPDMKSKRLGVLRRGLVIATYIWLTDEGVYSPYLVVQLPDNQTGYLYMGLWEIGVSKAPGGVWRFANLIQYEDPVG